MRYKANDVAKWLLYEAKRQGVIVTHMKLQKLLYYAQAYVIGMTGEKLFDDNIEAWQHGPVTPNVYYEYSKYGSSVIPCIEDIKVPDGISPLISFIVREKGSYSAYELSNMTHKGTAWREAIENPQSKVISEKMIDKDFVSEFWGADEEDEYQPTFDNYQQEREYFLNDISDEERNVIFNSR